MKTKFYLFFILLFAFKINAFGQNLTLSDLENISNKTNWEYANQYLLGKGWEYYESTKGNTSIYNTITWSFEKSRYDDKAVGWFYLYTYEGFPNKVDYVAVNKPAYTLIQNSLSSKGYTLKDSKIEDDQIISTYTNSKFILEITTEKRLKDDSYYSDNSLTAYNFLLIKKSGVYDPDNGKKTSYYYGDNVKESYTLLEGKLNGQYKSYHYNGTIKMEGAYVKGLENGTFKEYDEYGNLESQYIMSNGKLEGLMAVYKDGKLDYSITFKDDERNGSYTEYYYNDDTGELLAKLIGNNLNGKKDGIWKTTFDRNGKEMVLNEYFYINGIKNGPFLEVSGDSVIAGSYKDDFVHGDYKVFIDINKVFFGTTINTDTSSILLLSEGNYFNGLKSGYWKKYDFTNTLISEGPYLNDKREGVWNFYYSNYSSDDGSSDYYVGELFLVQTYSYDELNGKSTRYSYLNHIDVPCSEVDERKNPLDTCRQLVYEKVLETAFYKNDKLNGPFEYKDSLGGLIAKGNFINGLSEGKWFHRYDGTDSNDEIYHYYQEGNYLEGERDGKWIEYLDKDFIYETRNYKKGKMHGTLTSWNEMNKPRETKEFVNGKFIELVTYDSLGLNKNDKFEIYDETQNSYKTRHTEYFADGYLMQEYWCSKKGEIDHSWFELIFFIDKNPNLKSENGTIAYNDGAWELYAKDGKPLIIGKQVKANKVGLWRYYYYDQDVRLDNTFESNQLVNEKYFTINGESFSGDFIYYQTETDIKEERKIKDGLRNGKTVYIDTSKDKVINKENYKEGVLQ